MEPKKEQGRLLYFSRKYDKGQLELAMSVHVHYVFMAGQTETLNNTKENIKENFNISKSGKVKNFLGVYCEWCCDVKGTYVKMTMEKDVKNLIEGYEKFTVSDLRIQKTP